MTYDEAVDAMLTVFKTAWDPRAAVYDDVPSNRPKGNVVWARATVQHVTGRQGSLTGGLGTTKWDRNGFVWIQVFSPVGDGKKAGRDAGQILVNAYQDARLAVWFRNIRMTEGGSDGAFERFDVKADFEYSDTR